MSRAPHPDAGEVEPEIYATALSSASEPESGVAIEPSDC